MKKYWTHHSLSTLLNAIAQASCSTIYNINISKIIPSSPFLYYGKDACCQRNMSLELEDPNSQLYLSMPNVIAINSTSQVDVILSSFYIQHSLNTVAVCKRKFVSHWLHCILVNGHNSQLYFVNAKCYWYQHLELT